MSVIQIDCYLIILMVEVETNSTANYMPKIKVSAITAIRKAERCLSSDQDENTQQLNECSLGNEELNVIGEPSGVSTQ